MMSLLTITEERLHLFSKVNNVAVAFQNANKKNRKMAAIDFRDPENLEFFKTLLEKEVAYMLIGGFAMAFHGYIRATHDLSLWLKDSADNIDKFKNVLKAHGVKGLEEMRSFEMIPGFTQFQVGDSGFVVEPLKSLKTLQAYNLMRLMQGQKKVCLTIFISKSFMRMACCVRKKRLIDLKIKEILNFLNHYNSLLQH